MNNLVIIYRSCDRIDAFSGTPRIKPKKEVIKRCFNSLMTSIDYHKNTPDSINMELVVVDDMSSQETVDYLKSKTIIPSQFNVATSMLGNGGSLEKCYELADKVSEQSLIFFIEDDYLMEPTCIDEMMFAHRVMSKELNQENLVTHPVDYIDRYKKYYPSYIALGKSVHWRTIKHTTGTFCLPKKIFTDCRENYSKFTFYGERPGITEDNSINLTYTKYPCFSPMPSLAHHFQYESTLSPFLSVDSLWDDNG